MKPQVGASVVMPLLELGGVGYATYVFVDLLCVQYLLDPAPALDLSPRKSTAIGLLVAYFILLLAFLLTFLRLCQTRWTNPGYVPLQGNPEKPATFDSFARAFVSDPQGLPLWCESCHNFKPDRAHHSHDLDRCVMRMDHYCPWAGGMVGETTHKFFVQFLGYAAVYCGFVLICLAVFLAERIRANNGAPSRWIGALAVAALFFLFTFGMFLTTLWNLSNNETNVEMLQKHNATYLAIRANSSHSVPRLVLHTEPGEHPWDLGSRLANLKTVMGNSLVDWLLPLRMSPCATRKSEEGLYEWGPAVTRLLEKHPETP